MDPCVAIIQLAGWKGAAGIARAVVKRFAFCARPGPAAYAIDVLCVRFRSFRCIYLAVAITRDLSGLRPGVFLRRIGGRNDEDKCKQNFTW